MAMLHGIPALGLDAVESDTDYHEPAGFGVSDGIYGIELTVIKKFDQKVISLAQRLKATDIFLPELYLTKDADLSLLRHIPSLRSLKIQTIPGIDLRPIQQLKQLRALSLRAYPMPPQSLDFTQFPQLEACHITWRPEWASVLDCSSLRQLMLDNTKGIDLLDLKRLPMLRELWCSDCRGLKGVQFKKSQRLQSLLISRCRSFEDAIPFQAVRSLEYFSIYGNTRFDYRRLAEMKSLRRLWLNAVGKTDSLRFLTKCQKLEVMEFFYSTNILDGDLTFLLELPQLHKVLFESRKHYFPKFPKEWFLNLGRRAGARSTV